MSDANAKALLLGAAERGIRYLEGLESRPVSAQPAAIERLREALDTAMPSESREPAEVLRFLDELASPATVASAGGRYFGFVTGGALPVSVAANWLATAWDQNAFSFVSSPAIALIEETALRWLKQVFDLPPESEGAIVTGATMANFTCLAAARHEVLKRVGWDVEKRGLFGAPEIAVIAGDEVHGSVLKVLAMLGLGRERLVRVPVDAQGRMRADALPPLSGPAIVCMQAGNVNSGAFDPASEIVQWAHAAGAWVHVDGAFGLWAKAASARRALASGFERADSWATDAHKWLNVPYDSGIAFVRSREALHGAMSISGAYLLLGERRDAINFTPDSSRRARAIEVWAALQTLGRSGLADLIERNCRQARWLAEHLAAAGCSILNDVVLNQVVVSFGSDEATERVIAAIQTGGECWCGGTKWHGHSAMRISVSAWATTQQDLERTLAAILGARDRNG